MMSRKDGRNGEAQRRQSLRVDDELILFWKPSNDGYPADSQGLPDELVRVFSLISNLNALGEEFRTRIRALERENSGLAACLKLLDKKINRIAQAIVTGELSLPAQPAREVDLSASGLAFASERPIDPGTALDLKMILPASLLAIAAPGRVVHCEPRANPAETASGFTVGVEFTGLADHDRELLMRHVFRKQKIKIRHQRRST